MVSVRFDAVCDECLLSVPRFTLAAAFALGSRKAQTSGLCSLCASLCALSTVEHTKLASAFTTAGRCSAIFRLLWPHYGVGKSLPTSCIALPMLGGFEHLAKVYSIVRRYSLATCS
jgi:hypothetical protein